MNLPSFNIKWLQNLTIYQTVTRIVIVGSNNAKTRFRLFQIDRTVQNDLVVYNDENDYDKYEIHETLTMLLVKHSASNRDKKKAASQPQKAFGIVGFVKFLEGYYLILLTKRCQIAEIGGHNIYKIEDTSMIYIPNVDCSNPDENRYVRMFQTVDLSSNFYYSYSYDLTNTLQHNMLKLKSSQIFDQKASTGSGTKEEQRKMASETGLMSNYDLKTGWKSTQDENCSVCGPNKKGSSEGSEKKFLWNAYLQEKMKDVNWLWRLDIIHGYINQSCVNLFGERIYITLIGRRSNKFAGTRFLKRGCNLKGDVANDVETEQIVHCASMTSMHHAPYTSYVQHRGSIPVHWSQDITANVVPAKPPICLTSDNSYAQSTGKHFEEMMKRYGTPITVLNLVKKRDKKANESMLGHEFKIAVEYLNQFMRTKHQIKYHALDMAHLLRGTKLNVLARLANVAESSIQSTGFFQSKPDLILPDGRKEDPKWQKLGGEMVNGYRIQTGVLRTNCVDCLDRTNSAQFVASKCALAYQLFSLGVIDQLDLSFDTDAMRLFEEMFEAHGDIIALQYGGSLLVHTIQSYRRLANPWSTHSRDIVTTLSRYYSNTFSDADKQSAINLFLGVFRPSTNLAHLWEIPSDEYLHNDEDTKLKSLSSDAYTHWWKSDLAKNFPLPLSIANIEEERCSRVTQYKLFRCSDCSDWYVDFHRVDELTSFDDCYSIKMPNTATRCEAAGYEDVNPFTVRSKEGGVPDHETTSLNKYEDDDEDSDWVEYVSSDDNESLDSGVEGQINENNFNPKHNQHQLAPWLRKPKLEDFSAKNVYGIDLKVGREDIELYKRHVEFKNIKSNFKHMQEEELTTEPTVDENSLRIYQDCVSFKFHVDRQFYRDYINKFQE